MSFKVFTSKEEQDKWVAESIIHNLKEDELTYDDIIVINPNPLTTKQYVGPIRKYLFNHNIQSHTAGVDCDPDIFYESDSITFTGIFRAKGNEAAMVYVINANECYDETDTQSTSKVRNELFTAITRSKAWVRVVGYGEDMMKLKKEYEEVMNHDYTLDFIYPTQKQLEYLKIINRDMSIEEKKNMDRQKTEIDNLISKIENREMYAEDLGEDTLRKLRKIFGGCQ